MIPKEQSLACDIDLDECKVEYNDEEGDNELGDGSIIDEVFANLLEKVDLSDTKVFSQFAFLSNMAYVIPQMKV